MSVKRIASRYAKSLLDLSVERNETEQVLADMQGFKKALESRDLKNLIKSPIISEGKKKQVFDAIFRDKFGKTTMAFIDLILNKTREAYLPSIAEEFIVQYNMMKRISTATLTVASQITDQQLNDIKSKLQASKITLDNLDVNVEVNPEIIGGFVLEIGDMRYDSSAKHKLDQLKKEFTRNDYVASI